MPRRFGMVVLLLLMCALSLLSCGGKSAPDSLRFGLASAPVTLDPRFATDATSARINRLLYRQLVEFDAAQQPSPVWRSGRGWRRCTTVFIC